MRAAALAVAGSLIAISSSSTQAQNICTGILSYASRDELQDDKDSATAQSIYSENCQGSSVKAAKRTDIGLEAVIKAIPARFNLGTGRSEERLSNFCKVASEQNISNEKFILRKSSVVREALDAFNRCVQLSNSTAYFDPIIGSRDISVSVRRGSNNVNITGLSYDDASMTCSIATKTETKVADLNTRAEINDSSAVPIICTRKGAKSDDGVIQYPRAELTILTDQANFTIPVDSDAILPPMASSAIVKQIQELRSNQQSQIDVLRGDIEKVTEEGKCSTKGIPNRTPTTPAWSALQCERGTYMRGIEFTHPGGQDFTFQEAVRITCCPLKK